METQLGDLGPMSGPARTPRNPVVAHPRGSGPLAGSTAAALATVAPVLPMALDLVATAAPALDRCSSPGPGSTMAHYMEELSVAKLGLRMGD